MPPKLMPPDSPTTSKFGGQDLLCTRAIPQTGSTPNLSTLENESISSRLKRKRDDCTTCVDEIRSLLASSTAQYDDKFAALQSAMSEIIAQNSDIKESISFISKQYDDMKLKVQNLESERELDRYQILQLEDKVENLERMLHSTKIEIRNVPKKLGETKEDLCRIVTDLTKVLSTPIQKNEIKDVFRGSKKEGAPPILVDLVSTMSKDSILKGTRQFNHKNGQNKLTDHSLVLAGINITKPKDERQSRVKLKRDYDAIAKDLHAVDWSAVYGCSDVNTATDFFTEILMCTINSHSNEVRVSRSKHNLKPWITPGLMRCMRHRDRLHLQAREDPKNKVLRLTYSRYHNFFKTILRKLKSDYEENELKANMSNPKRLWRSVKNICHLTKSKQEPIELLSVPGSPDAQASLNECNKHFTTIGQKLADKILATINQTESDLAKTVRLKRTPPDSLYLNPTDAAEIRTLIMGLDNAKAPGIDGLGNLLVKRIKDEIVEPLAFIFNMSLSAGSFPNQWKVASVCPIFKNGNKESIDNYRPISLLGVFSKLLEKIMNMRLTSFLEYHNLISPRQFGFRKARCTEDAVSLLTSTVSAYLDTGQCCIGVFLDLAKAFDTVSVPILLKKLECLGIRGIPLDWFKSYLTERRQCLQVSSTRSEAQTIHFGVPQGSILGPTLFKLYINDIHELSINNAEIVCYADDTAVVFHGSSWQSVSCAAETGMSQINAWLQQNLLTLNTQKTMYVCFHKTSASAPPFEMHIKIHSNCSGSSPCRCDLLTRTMVMKYLGVLIDQNLNFKHHLEGLSSRIRKVINIMRKLRDVACVDLIKSIYFALCQSLLLYCVTCWGSAAKTYMLLVERAQRSVLKVMLRKPYRYPTIDLYRDIGVLNVRQLFILRTSTAVHRSLLTSANYEVLTKRRNYKIPAPSCKTSFAQRFGEFIKAHVYNSVVKFCHIKNKPVYEAKRIINKWLLNLAYDATEDVLLKIT